MSVNMFGLRLTTDAHARSSSGRPHHKTTGVAKIHWRTENLSNMPSTSTGTLNVAAIQNRPVMPASSGFTSSSSVTISGSRAMPHFGHAPGRFRRTSGCIGHVYVAAGIGGGGLGTPATSGDTRRLELLLEHSTAGVVRVNDRDGGRTMICASIAPPAWSART